MSTSQTSDQLLLKANPKLSAEDIKSYKVKKAQLFKFTVALCAIYGVIAFILLMVTLFTSQGNLIFTQEIRPFTITFIGGIVFVIILLIIQIMSFKPIALTVNSYDRDICPDFWKLTPTPDSDSTYSGADREMKGFYQYQCKPDPNVYGQSASSNTKTLDLTNLDPTNTTVKLANLIGTGTNKKNLQCDQVFPNYLANKNANDDDIKSQPNALACEYAKQCGIPWANVCGN
jgi:hypothetical protein